MRRSLLLFAFLLGPAAGIASAYTGTLTGRLLFYDARTYAAAPGEGPYTTAMKNTWRPVRYAKLYAYLANSSTVIGTGTTDESGNFSFTWTSGFSNPSASIAFYYESAFTLNGSSRFQI